MKGFLGTFIVFILWASICFYYINIGSTSNSSSISIIKNDSINTSTKEQYLTSDFFLSTNTNTTTSFTHIDSTESKRIANEIEKSIPISDTTHFNKEIPSSELEKEITRNTSLSSILRPSYNDTGIILDDELINFATELKEFLLENKDKKVTIIGYTDSTGNNEESLAKGLKRASQVRWYLTAKRGISTSNIIAISKGEDNPIKDNTTSSGRAQNNRIEIIVN